MYAALPCAIGPWVKRFFCFTGQPDKKGVHMELPAELVNVLTVIIGGFIVKLVTDGVKALSESMGYDLGKVGAMIAAALSACAVTISIGLLNFGLSFVPLEYAPV